MNCETSTTDGTAQSEEKRGDNCEWNRHVKLFIIFISDMTHGQDRKVHAADGNHNGVQQKWKIIAHFDVMQSTLEL